MQSEPDIVVLGESDELVDIMDLYLRVRHVEEMLMRIMPLVEKGEEMLNNTPTQRILRVLGKPVKS